MAEGRERMLAGAVDRLGDDLSEDRREDVQARLGARSCRACEAGPHTCGLDDKVRVHIVVNHRTMRVHGVTADEETALAWMNEVTSKYGGDPLSVSRAVDVIEIPGVRRG